MKKKLIILSLIVLTVLAAITAWPLLIRQDKAAAAPEVFAGGINGGCYITAPNVCKIHVDPFIVNVDDGGGFKLVEFQLQAVRVVNMVEQAFPIYNFKTDARPEYRQGGDYQPTLVALDYAASCDEDYFIRLVAQDESDAELFEVAKTQIFTCPIAVP